MQSPFPGMDPYLELDWGDFHSNTASGALEQLNDRLPEDLACRSEKRFVVCDSELIDLAIVPEVSAFKQPGPERLSENSRSSPALADEVLLRKLPPYEFPQHSLNIVDLGTGGRVITTIEFVSPVNKRPGDGLEKYRQKQKQCRQAKINLVEIDFCRSGDRTLIFPIATLQERKHSTYAALVSRVTRPFEASLFRLPIRERLGGIPIPLRPTDQEVVLELQPIVDHVYRTGRYGAFGLYERELQPPLNSDDADWSRNVIESK